MIKRALLISLLFSMSSHAQLPGNDIILIDIIEKSGVILLKNEVNITNKKGYENQPVFLDNDQKVYYTRFENQQADIYQYDIASQKTSIYLQTDESEYSPTKKPKSKGMSVVRVEKSNDQHIYWLNNHKSKQKQVKLSPLKLVGYHNWTGKKHLWTFVINQDQGDLYYQKLKKEETLIDSNIGRSLKVDKDFKNLYYVSKKTQPYSIMKVNHKTKKPEFVMNLPKDEEDFTLDSKGRFWTGVENTLYVSEGQIWKKVKEFNLPNLSNISRITVNSASSQIALVFDEIE